MRHLLKTNLEFLEDALCCFQFYAQSHSDFNLYIPTDTEMQYFMNLYAKLKSIEAQASVAEVGSIISDIRK